MGSIQTNDRYTMLIVTDEHGTHIANVLTLEEFMEHLATGVNIKRVRRLDLSKSVIIAMYPERSNVILFRSIDYFVDSDIPSKEVIKEYLVSSHVIKAAMLIGAN